MTLSGAGKRIGILGSGFGTRVTAPALRAEGWEIRALFSRRPDRAEEIARKLEIPHHTADFRALVARDDLDAVVVSTPTSTHHEIALAALEAGKHVLCEKPFAANLAEARALALAARRSHSTMMCNFEFRYSDHRLHITRLLEDGLIGRPRSATATLNFARPMATGALDWRSRLDMGGGALNEHGSHYFDALRVWLGPITSVAAHVATHEPERTDPETGATLTSDADDFVAAMLTFASGAVASVSIIWSAGVPGDGTFHITGPGGTISHHSPSGLFAAGPVTHTAPMTSAGRPEVSEPIPLPADLEPLPDTDIIAGSRRLLRDFARGIDEGHSPSPNYDDGVSVQAVLDAARESSRSGRTVHVEQV